MPEAQLLLSLIQQFIAIQSFISKFDALIRRAAVRNISHIIHSLLYFLKTQHIYEALLYKPILFP